MRVAAAALALLPACVPLYPVPPAGPLPDESVGDFGAGYAYGLGTTPQQHGAHLWARFEPRPGLEAGSAVRAVLQDKRNDELLTLSPGAYLRWWAVDGEWVRLGLHGEAGLVFGGVGLPLSVGNERLSLSTQPTLVAGADPDSFTYNGTGDPETGLLLPLALSARFGSVGLHLQGSRYDSLARLMADHWQLSASLSVAPRRRAAPSP